MTDSRITQVAASGPDLDVVFDDILAPNFPAHELVSKDVIADGVAAGSTSVLLALDEDGNGLGTAIGDWSPEHRVQLLMYLAVDARRRAGGVGGRLLDGARRRWARDHGPFLLLAEVEHPATPVGEAAWGDPKRRYDFYVRHGALVLDLPYFQPALSAGAKRGYGMLLIALHVDDELRASDSRVRSAPVGGYLRDYFRESEGRVPDDADAAALFAAVDDERGIALLDPGVTPIERLPRSVSPTDG